MKTIPLKIISGGQTGVDRAALDAAMALGVPGGGWCPSNRTDEEGLIPERYPLTPLKKGGYAQRTLQNVLDADGTLIIYFSLLEGGTAETVVHCIENGKPFKLIDGSEVPVARAAQLAFDFVRTHKPRSLNVAGPRASKNPEAYPYAFEVVSALLRGLKTGGVP